MKLAWFYPVLVLLMGVSVVSTSLAAVPAGSAAAVVPIVTTVSAISCASTSDCWAGAVYAAGADIIATTDGGTVWRVEAEMANYDGFSGIDCTSASHCVAIADRDDGTVTALLETSDGGKVWTAGTVPKSLAIAESTSCPTSSDCWVIGLAGNRLDAALAVTTDGGATWASRAVPKLETAMSSQFGISCPSTSRCVATGIGTLTTDDGGRTWARHALPGVPLGPVTCPSTVDCYAVFNVTSAIPANEETFIYTSSDGGITWEDVLEHPSDVAGLAGISCTSTSKCVSVGGGYTPVRSGNDHLYALSESTSAGGSKWGETRLPKVQYLYSVSCGPSSTDCIAVGALNGKKGAIVKSTNDGATWASELLP